MHYLGAYITLPASIEQEVAAELAAKIGAAHKRGRPFSDDRDYLSLTEGGEIHEEALEGAYAQLPVDKVHGIMLIHHPTYTDANMLGQCFGQWRNADNAGKDTGEFTVYTGRLSRVRDGSLTELSVEKLPTQEGATLGYAVRVTAPNLPLAQHMLDIWYNGGLEDPNDLL